jgi:hypothetical protein
LPSPIARRKREIDFLDEVQQPRHIHQSEQRRGNRQDSRGVGFGDELPHAQSEHEQNQEAGFKIVHAGGRIVHAEIFRRQMQKSPGQQQHAADGAAPFEAGISALFGEAVKFRQPGHG